MRRTHRQEVVHFSNGPGQRRRGDRPAYPPAREAVGLGNGVDGDRLISHPWKSGDAHMLGAVVKNVLVDFVCDGYDPPLSCTGWQ